MDKRSYRRFTAEEKRTILEEAQQPGVTLAEVCRKNGDGLKTMGEAPGSIRNRSKTSRETSVTTCTSFGIAWSPAAIFRRRSKPCRYPRRAGEHARWECQRLRIEWPRPRSRWSSSRCSSQSLTATRSVIVRGALLWTQSNWFVVEAGTTTGWWSSTSKRCLTGSITSFYSERFGSIAKHRECCCTSRDG